MNPIHRLRLAMTFLLAMSADRLLARTYATAQGAGDAARASAAPIGLTVDEGTSMSVAASPDGQSLAIDLQGSIWTLPATGGVAKRITDLFNDARQPAWSPDGKWIAYSSDKGGDLLQLWIRDLKTGQDRQLTNVQYAASSAPCAPGVSTLACNSYLRDRTLEEIVSGA